LPRCSSHCPTRIPPLRPRRLPPTVTASQRRVPLSLFRRGMRGVGRVEPDGKRVTPRCGRVCPNEESGTTNMRPVEPNSERVILDWGWSRRSGTQPASLGVASIRIEIEPPRTRFDSRHLRFGPTGIETDPTATRFDMKEVRSGAIGTRETLSGTGSDAIPVRIRPPATRIDASRPRSESPTLRFGPPELGSLHPVLGSRHPEHVRPDPNSV
jgi:hypothetical protein